jgi:hypothetical protein
MPIQLPLATINDAQIEEAIGKDVHMKACNLQTDEKGNLKKE